MASTRGGQKVARESGEHYSPLARWIVVRDMARQVIEFIDTTEEDAVEALRVKCEEMKAAGWTLEESKFNWVFANKSGDRRFIAVENDHPMEIPPAPPRSY